MSGLIQHADGSPAAAQGALERAQLAWQESMLRQANALRDGLRLQDPTNLAHRSATRFDGRALWIQYWGADLRMDWPALEVTGSGRAASVFDTAMVLYYLTTATGAALADRWVGYRDLPGGTFYERAFQGYSGDRLAKAFGNRPEELNACARALGGWPLPALADHAFAFQPLPRIRLAGVLWPGDDELPARASVLFDAADSEYMTTDGLALLGSGLAGRLIARQSSPSAASEPEP
jgi:Domain of unknown function (DUF3786)